MHWAFCDITDKILGRHNMGNLSLLIFIRTSQYLRVLHGCGVQEGANRNKRRAEVDQNLSFYVKSRNSIELFRKL